MSQIAVAAAAVERRRFPLTFWIGLAVMLTAMGLMYADVYFSGRGRVHTFEEAESYRLYPESALPWLARWVAYNVCPLVWLGYMFFIEGLLVWQTGSSPIRRRPNHFWLLCGASVFIWCVFDAINFYLIDAWIYIGMQRTFPLRLWGYLIAFAAIVPGMLLSGQALMNAGAFDWARGRKWAMPGWLPWASLVVGAAMFAWPLVHWDPITNFTLWTSLVFLLDPINYWRGRPSMLRDFSNGWYGRMLACMAGGAVCGLLWEFWNYYALSKWVYQLPFFGELENIRYFEMPVIGFLGFLPFGKECWVMWQSMRMGLDGLVEPLPDEKTVL